MIERLVQPLYSFIKESCINNNCSKTVKMFRIIFSGFQLVTGVTPNILIITNVVF